MTKPRTPIQALSRLCAGNIDFKTEDNKTTTLDGVVFTDEQIVLMDRLGMRMSLHECLKRFMPANQFKVDEKSRSVSWYDYHGVTFDGDHDRVDLYVRNVIEKKIGYCVSQQPLEFHHSGNGHLWATWQLMSDETCTELNKILVRSGQKPITNRKLP